MFRKNLIDYFKKKVEKSDDVVILKAPPTISQNLPLIIKRYDYPEAFSNFIHHSTQEKFEIEGPFVNF